MTNRTPISSRIRKDGGIKLLDINEQPLGYAQAKRRKRLMEMEEQQKKVEEAKVAATTTTTTSTTTTTETLTTPEYAQGLAPIGAPATPVSTTTTTVLPQPYNIPISTTIPIAVITPSLQACEYFQYFYE
jgi:negative elongation factor A